MRPDQAPRTMHALSPSSGDAMAVSSTRGSSGLAPAQGAPAAPSLTPYLAVTPSTPVVSLPAEVFQPGADDDDSFDDDDCDDTPKKHRLFRKHESALEDQFEEMDTMLSSLSAKTGLDETYLRRKYLKRSEPKTAFSGDNTWNDFRAAFKATQFREEELERTGLMDEYAMAQREPDKRTCIIDHISFTYESDII